MLKISKDAAKSIDSDFQLKIESITRYHTSEINQELFDKVYGEGTVNSEEEFREKIKENIQENLIADSEYKFMIDAREMMMGKFSELSFPDTFLKRWILSSDKNLTAEKLEADYPHIITDYKWILIKDKIKKANQIKVETADIEKYAKKMIRAQFTQYGMIGMDDEIVANYAKEMMKKEENMKDIEDKVTEEKVVAVIKEAVTLDNEEISIDEFNKMFKTK
jgi:trigger factor